MDWDRDLPSWPLNHLSRQVTVRPHRWHVQEAGSGPTLLLLHGAGASTHTWRDLIPLLTPSYHVVAIDLPGQGFTRLGTKARCGLAPMTEDILRLCDSEDWRPDLVVGHSAGGALALTLSQALANTATAGPGIIGINPALGRFDGVAGWLFPILAKLLAINPLTSYAFSAGGARPSRARNLIESTGSHLSDEGVAFYARLIADRPHVEGTLQMMAQWNIDALINRLEGLNSPCLFLTGGRDLAIAPSVSQNAAARMPNAEVLTFPKLGHLAHEEAPDDIARHILDWPA